MPRIVHATVRRQMNYRHAYHAGNFADVFKHVTLVGLLGSLKAKPAPFCYVDTHAGRGVYDLGGIEASKTHEADDGVRRLLALADLPPPVGTYVDLVRELNALDDATVMRRYPGSPLLAGALLRERDSAVLCELQPGEVTALRSALQHRKAFHVHQRDGYGALRALLPPPERRGLVLIDPPFEPPQREFALLQAALEDALQRWPTGRYAVWYPIKLRRDRNAFHRWLRQHGRGRWLIAELLVHPDNSSLRLNGCGLAMIQPPWQFERTMTTILDVLSEHLAQDGFSDAHVECADGASS